MNRIAILSLWVLAGCGRAVPASAPPTAAGDALLPERGAVLPESPEIRIAMLCSHPSSAVEGTWTPTPEQIRELEAGLTPLLRERLAVSAPGRTHRLASYYRQYAGIVAGGRKRICVNGVAGLVDAGSARADSFPWREHVVEVADGGTGVFHVEYEPATRQFSHFAFNGVA